MNPIFKKLNYKEQNVIYILHAPESFQSVMEEMNVFTNIKTTLSEEESAGFILAFVTQQAEIDALTPLFSKALQGDGLLWFAYPKGTSKKYKCDFNRDTGWDVLGQHGFEGVRQVAIDEDWSALRFRRAEYIKTMKREKLPAMSEVGKRKLGN